MAFDLSEALKGVSMPDTKRERFAYLPYAALIPDETNGYSMTGIDELSRSIEIVGLQQPLRVKDQGDETYKLISGHRRHAAIGELLKRDPRAFADGIPCIIDAAGGSEVLRELQLLLANADNRKLTPADELQQTERISDCLRRLEDEGFKFPGRHRDWVSKISGLSRSKLARQDAIKNHLVTGLLNFFMAGALNETAAYELQKLPEDAQTAIAESFKRGGSAASITAEAAAFCVKNAEKFTAARKCKDGGECDHHARRFVQALRSQYGWARCDGACCLKCSELDRCKFPCEKGRAKQSADKAAEEKKNEKLKAEREREDEKRQREYRAAIQAEARRVLPLIEAAGLDGRNTLPGAHYYQTQKISEIKDYAAGNFGDRHFYDSYILPYETKGLIEWAEKLNCSLDYLVGRSDEPQPVSAQDTAPKPQEISVKHLGWLIGTPPDGAKCWARFAEDEIKPFTMLATYNADHDAWYVGDHFDEKCTVDQICLGWWPLPEDDAPDLPGDLTPNAPPKPSAEDAPKWQTGKPKKEGLYAVRFKVGPNAPGELDNFARWEGGQWHAMRSGKIIADLIAIGWYPLPEED